MQQGHPRHKQINRSKHEMYLHNKHKTEDVWTAIKSIITGIGNVIKPAWKRVQSVFSVDEQMPAPNVDYDKFEIKDIATDMFRNNAGIVNGN